jgi:hypothetical protein
MAQERYQQFAYRKKRKVNMEENEQLRQEVDKRRHIRSYAQLHSRQWQRHADTVVDQHAERYAEELSRTIKAADSEEKDLEADIEELESNRLSPEEEASLNREFKLSPEEAAQQERRQDAWFDNYRNYANEMNLLEDFRVATRTGVLPERYLRSQRGNFPTIHDRDEWNRQNLETPAARAEMIRQHEMDIRGWERRGYRGYYNKRRARLRAAGLRKRGVLDKVNAVRTKQARGMRDVLDWAENYARTGGHNEDALLRMDAEVAVAQMMGEESIAAL